VADWARAAAVRQRRHGEQPRYRRTPPRSVVLQTQPRLGVSPAPNSEAPNPGMPALIQVSSHTRPECCAYLGSITNVSSHPLLQSAIEHYHHQVLSCNLFMSICAMGSTFTGCDIS